MLISPRFEQGGVSPGLYTDPPFRSWRTADIALRPGGRRTHGTFPLVYSMFRVSHPIHSAARNIRARRSLCCVGCGQYLILSTRPRSARGPALSALGLGPRWPLAYGRDPIWVKGPQVHALMVAHVPIQGITHQPAAIMLHVCSRQLQETQELRHHRKGQRNRLRAPQPLRHHLVHR